MPDAAGALVTMSGITKRFGGVLACDDVELSVRAGEVRALLGENGAGKSTLMNVLAGVITDHEGTITVAGRPCRFRSPAEAQAAGIAMIHQELDLVPGLSVAENIFLGREPRTRLRTVAARRMAAAARTQLAELGVELDPNRSVGSLRVGEQQLVEIAKALSSHSGPQAALRPTDARVLVMDEPTAALTDAEVRLLFATIARLRERGRSDQTGPDGSPSRGRHGPNYRVPMAAPTTMDTRYSGSCSRPPPRTPGDAAEHP